MLDQQLEIILRLAFVAEFRDDDTSRHLRRLSLLAELLGSRLGLAPAELAALVQATPLHDIGKVGIPDEILLKPGALTAEERETMQQHTILGARMLSGSGSPVLQTGEQICLTHHERWDGLGYPAGLSGEAIPLCGRIVALIDVWDALVTRRVYKPAVPAAAARTTLANEAGRHFDPAVVAAFLDLEAAIAAVYAEWGEDDEGWLA
ncbi:MAG: HD domain-containing protein [Fimbriimonadaceae bacterium]|nr:HD domain-containing protein [Fimbriimonadaceae bacterium]